MSHHFFLSYSRADNSPLLKRFFDDLSDTIRIELNLPHTQAVGFYEEPEYGPTPDWSDAAKEALQDSGVMVCLVSPAYLHCERAGKEWQVFDERRRRTVANPGAQGPLPESLAHVILPVTWSQLHGPVPTVVNELLAHPDHIHQRQSLMAMFKSSGMSHREYNEFVRTLANQIIELTPAASNLLPLDPLPPMSEVHRAFRLWDQATSGVEKGRVQCKRYEVPCWHAELVTDAAVREREVSTSQVGSDSSPNPPKQSSSTSHRKTEANEYSVVAFSKDGEILDRIEVCCRFSIFKLKKEEDAAKVLRDAKINSKQSKKLLPDLFVIDLDNGPEGLEIVKELSEKMNVTSEILVISDNFESSNLHQFKRYTILQKSDLDDQLFNLMKRGAKFGRNRRIFRETRELDPSRFERPVFLSVCHKDEITANFLSRHLDARAIGVWIMYETLKPGDDWYFEIVNGLEDAKVFIALITKDYLRSMDCRAEFDSAYLRTKRKKNDEQRPHLISILYNLTDIENDEFMGKKVRTHHYVRMSDEEYLDELDSLTRRIQDLLGIKDDDKELHS